MALNPSNSSNLEQPALKGLKCAVLNAAPPVMKCERSVTTPVHKLSVRLVCHIMSTPPLSDAHITWDGQQHLRPTERPGWPPGVKFDRDQEYAAYLRQVKLLPVLQSVLQSTLAYHLRLSTIND